MAIRRYSFRRAGGSWVEGPAEQLAIFTPSGFLAQPQLECIASRTNLTMLISQSDKLDWTEQSERRLQSSGNPSQLNIGHTTNTLFLERQK